MGPMVLDLICHPAMLSTQYLSILVLPGHLEPLQKHLQVVADGFENWKSWDQAQEELKHFKNCYIAIVEQATLNGGYTSTTLQMNIMYHDYLAMAYPHLILKSRGLITGNWQSN